ncbi:MAG: SUMF1/EgtB/PvdO family nonheme iron enzyme, partial [Opitutae bacterium]|nr:SUMF1/EgtB/PvdO family nonheme iron enzyme [Opitutae bacterium]
MKKRFAKRLFSSFMRPEHCGLLVLLLPILPCFGSGSFNAASVPGLKLWMDANDSSSFTLADSNVTQWRDRSGYGHVFDQISGTSVPTRTVSNGTGLVSFDSNSTLSTNTDLMDANYTIFSVSRQTGGLDQRFITSASTNWAFGYFGGKYDSFYFNGWVNSGSSASNTDWHVHAASVNDSDQANAWVDFAQVASDQSGANNTNYSPRKLALGGSLSGERSNGEIAEILYFDRILTTGERAQVEGYLAHKWDLASLLPGGHAHKSTSPTFPAPDFTNGLVGHYLFDGNASDVSGNGNHGTISGAVPGADRNGATGKALVFDGNDHVMVNHAPSLTPSNGKLSISLWVHSTDFARSSWEEFLMKGHVDYREYLLRPVIGTGQASFVVYGQNNQHWLTSSSILENNKWNHLTVTSDGSMLRMYLNGTFDANMSSPGITFKQNTRPLAFGKLGQTNMEYFNGSIDEVRIYDRALPAPEVAALYQLENTPPNTPPTDLNSTAPLTIAENQPIGTLVGEFNATDPDAGATLTYHLVPGAGDTHNSLFTLETNGTLKTATIFDFESNASSYAIRVQAKDEHNASVEGNFTVSLTDVYEPSQPNHLVDLNSSVNLEMIWVEPGTFTMGQAGIAGAVHNVTLTRGYYMSKFEVTQAEYEAVMTGNANGLSATPSNWPNNPNRPVEQVTWDDTQLFLTRLNDA